MIDEKKKMTTQDSSVGADDGQSISKNSDISITTSKEEINDEVGKPGRNVPQDTAHERPGLPAHCNPG